MAKVQKSRNLITFPLDIPEVEVISVEINKRGDYIVTVESTLNSAICQSCGDRITKPNGYGREIELRHLPILDIGCTFACAPNGMNVLTVMARRAHKSWIGMSPRAHTRKRMTGT